MIQPEIRFRLFAYPVLRFWIVLLELATFSHCLADRQGLEAFGDG